jgi:hypothetical protein
MGMNFPNAPAVGQLYPAVPSPGTMQYRWDGTVWAAANVLAADIYSYGGIQSNGSMEVSQEFGAAAQSTSGQHVVDQWVYAKGASVTAVAPAQQVTDAPPGFLNSVKFAVTTAQAAIAAADYFGLMQGIEGYRMEGLAWGTSGAQPLTLGFWCKAHRTGLYSGAIRNSVATRSYPFTWTQNAADTWEWKTIAVPGDALGAWATGTGLGMILSFMLAIGATSAGPPGAWAAGNFYGATGVVNGIAAVTDTFQITGVVILPTTNAPSAAASPKIMRPYDRELQLCMRYVEMGSFTWSTISGAGLTRNFSVVVPFIVQKRIAPTMTAPGGFTLNRTTNASLASQNTIRFVVGWNNTDNTGDDMQVSCAWKGDARLI